MRHFRYTDSMTERAAVRVVSLGMTWYDVAIEDSDLRVMVRLSRAPSGRLAVVELVLGRWPGVSADSLRSIPLGRVEQWANGPGRDDVLAALDHRATLSDDDRAKADSLARQRVTWGEPPPGAVDALPSITEALGITEQYAAGLAAVGFELDGKPVALRSRVRNLTLRVPEGQPKPDSFYKQLARLYEDIALDTPRTGGRARRGQQGPDEHRARLGQGSTTPRHSRCR